MGPKICLLARRHWRHVPGSALHLSGVSRFSGGGRSELSSQRQRRGVTRESPAAMTPRARNNAETNAIIRQGQYCLGRKPIISFASFASIWGKNCIDVGVKLRLRTAAIARRCASTLRGHGPSILCPIILYLYTTEHRIRQYIIHASGTSCTSYPCHRNDPAASSRWHLTTSPRNPGRHAPHPLFLWCRMTNHLPSPRPLTSRADPAAPGWLGHLSSFQGMPGKEALDWTRALHPEKHLHYPTLISRKVQICTVGTLNVSSNRPKQCQCYYGRSLSPGVCQQENANTPCRAPQCREPAIITPIPPKSSNPQKQRKSPSHLWQNHSLSAQPPCSLARF